MKVNILSKIYLIDYDYGYQVLSIHYDFQKAKQSAGKHITWIRSDGYLNGVRRYFIQQKTVK